MELRGLRVVTREVLNATLCLTMCPRCAASGQPPQIMLSTAQRLVAAHTVHLRRLDEPARVPRRRRVTPGSTAHHPPVRSM